MGGPVDHRLLGRWGRHAVRAARPHTWPAVAGALLGSLALGPALGRGFTLSYDMVFVPRPPIGPADFGMSGAAPRPVPSDLFIALLGRIAPEQLVQKMILLAIFVIASSGAAALLTACRAADPAPLFARLITGVCYTWNPFVAERLIMGQWAFLLGYAGLPWVLRAICGPALTRRSTGRILVALLPAAVGGFAAMTITALAAVPVAAVRGRRQAAVVAGLIITLSLPWLIPALSVPIHTDPAAVDAFAGRADTPFGSAGSLLMLGGIWNAQAVPAGYGGVTAAAWLAVTLLAIVGYALIARPWRICPGLGASAMAGYAIAGIGLTGGTRAVLRGAISLWPGFAVLRDGQQFVAPLALAEAIGLGAGAWWLLVLAGAVRGTRPQPGAVRGTRPQPGAVRGTRPQPGAVRGTRPQPGAVSRPVPDHPTAARQRSAAGPAAVLATLALLAPVVLLPGMAWGAAGRLDAVEYPPDWLRARQLIDGDPQPGSVLLLPWFQYRQYGWNGYRTVYDPWPRLLSRPVIWNDALTVGSITVAAESISSARMSTALARHGPLTALLVHDGVRYVIADSGLLAFAGPRKNDRQLARLARIPGARVVMASPDLVVFLLPST